MHYIEVSTYKLILLESQFHILPVSKAVGLIHAKLTFEGATTTVLKVFLLVISISRHWQSPEKIPTQHQES